MALGPLYIHEEGVGNRKEMGEGVATETGGNVCDGVLTDTLVLTERNIKILPKLYLSRLGKP